MIYTTNAIESVNMGLPKITKNRGSFPNDGSVPSGTAKYQYKVVDTTQGL